MITKRSFQGKESLHRMNFLYQACQLLQSSPRNAANTRIAAFYGSVMTSVGKKCVLRMDPSIKRTLCKGCNLVLLPGQSAKIRVRRKRTEVWCELCRTRKCFNLRQDHHKTWPEREESVVEQFQCKDEQVGHQVKHLGEQASSIGQSECRDEQVRDIKHGQTVTQD